MGWIGTLKYWGTKFLFYKIKDVISIFESTDGQGKMKTSQHSLTTHTSTTVFPMTLVHNDQVDIGICW